jgi:hypothetical protein
LEDDIDAEDERADTADGKADSASVAAG